MGTETRIIDVDAHAEPAPGWLDEFPDLATRLPELLPDTDPRFALGSAEMFAWFVSDDLLRQVPAAERMPMDRIVNPAMTFMGDRAMGQREGVGHYFRHTYWYDVDFGVAWFIAALLVFSVAWAAWRSKRPASAGSIGPLQRRHLLSAAAFIAVASFAVRLLWPFLDTGQLIGLNLWEYPQMLALFVLGALTEERRWLVDGLSDELRRLCGRAALLAVLAIVIVAVGITLSDDPDPFLGGLRVQARLVPISEATIAVSMSLWATDWFRRRWNRTTKVAREAGRASFAAYLVHAPITVILAAALRDVGVPAEVKFLAVLALAVVASFALGSLLTRSHAVARVL